MNLQFASVSVNCACEISVRNVPLPCPEVLPPALSAALASPRLASPRLSLTRSNHLYWRERGGSGDPAKASGCRRSQEYLTAWWIRLHTACHNGEIVPDCIDLRLYLESSLTENSELRLLQQEESTRPALSSLLLSFVFSSFIGL